MQAVLRKMSDQTLVGIFRVSKTRLRPFFANVRHQIALRDELNRRGLL